MNQTNQRRIKYTWKFIRALLVLMPHLFVLKLSSKRSHQTITLRDRRISVYLLPCLHSSTPFKWTFLRALRVTLFDVWLGHGPCDWSGEMYNGSAWQHLGGGWGNENVDVAAKWLTKKVTLPYE